MQPVQAPPQQEPVTEAPVRAGLSEAEHQALRVQVAAVAAQQGALFEQEMRLQEQQGALKQQQEQLAAHLEEKRQELLQMADQVQTARAALKDERQVQIQSAAEQTEHQARVQAELEIGQKKLLKARHRIRLLRSRLKKHFHRRWDGADQQIRNREMAVDDQHRRIEKEAERLHAERQSLLRRRLEFNGEIELGKRQLQEEWQKLEQEQMQWQDQLERQESDLSARAQALDQREQALSNTKRAFGDAQLAWELKCEIAKQEVQGLESRIVNLRLKLSEYQSELRQAQGQASAVSGQRAVDAEEQAAATVHKAPPRADDAPCFSDNRHATVHQRVALELERLAEELDDQRLELVEYWQRLAVVWQQWEQAQLAAADNLQQLTRGLPEQEKAVHARLTALQIAEANLRHREQELSQVRQHLEAWAARLRLREAAWESQRDRLQADLQSREETAEKHLGALVELRQNWAQRRRQEIDQLQAERAACDKLRQEFTRQQEECWKRTLALDAQQRDLSEKTLALEEYRQRFVLRSQDASAVETRLERIRKRWVHHNASVMEAAISQFAQLQAAAAQIAERNRKMLETTEELSRREANLAERQSAWDESQAKSSAQATAVQKHIDCSRTQQARCERHIAELEAEVERLARVLLDEVETPETSTNLAA